MSSANELRHWGVKGMRWGHHKPEEPPKGDAKSKSPDEVAYTRKFATVREQLKRSGLDEEGLKAKFGNVKEFAKDHESEIAAVAVIGTVAAVAGISAYSNRATFKHALVNWKMYASAVDGLNLNWEKGVNLPSGTVFKRVSSVAESQVRPGGFFASFLENDIKAYKGFIPGYFEEWGIGHINNGGFVNHYKAVREVTAPSGKESFAIYKGLLQNHPDFRAWHLANLEGVKDIDKAPDEVMKTVFASFSHFWTDESHPATKIYFDAVKAKGYNALIDFNDAGKLAKTPMRVIDGSAFEIVKSERLKVKEIMRCLDEWTPEMRHSFFDTGDFLVHSRVPKRKRIPATKKASTTLTNWTPNGGKWSHDRIMM